MQKYALILLLLCLYGTTRGQAQGYNYYYWFDDSSYAPLRGTSLTDKWQFDVNVPWLDDSLHVLCVLVQDSEKRQSQLVKRLFRRIYALPSVASVYYWFDDHSDCPIRTDVQNGAFDVDASLLSDGLHSIQLRAVTTSGDLSETYRAYFIKTPVGGNGINRYDYWLNDDDISEAKTVILAEKSNPLQLITLLPVESRPLRSSKFHFEVQDGQPKVFAKNVIHLRFHDNAMRFSDTSKEFVDYQVGMLIEDVATLHKTQTVAYPAENNIKWFSLQAEKGDRLEFKTDKPCTLQLFDPSNEEVYNVCGSASMSSDGIYAEKSGSYYLALHDVTATTGTETALEYTHLDKFYVRSHSVQEMGVLPSAQVLSVTGNGLDNIPYVLLRNSGQTIVSDTVIAYSKADAKILFVFKGDEQLGSYDLVFHFDDGKSIKDIVIKDGVTLATPRFGIIDMDISDPHSTAAPYPVSIKITNTGNITYSDIPFFMAYNPVGLIDLMSYENFYIDVDSALIAGGLRDSYILDDFNGSGDTARVIASWIPFVEAGESRTYVLGFNAKDHANYNVNCWTGTPWSLYAPETWKAIENQATLQGDIVLPGTTNMDVPENHVTIGYLASPLSYMTGIESQDATHVSIKDMSLYNIDDVTEALRKAALGNIYWTISGSYRYTGVTVNRGSTGHQGTKTGNYYGKQIKDHGNLSDPITQQECLLPFPPELILDINRFSSWLGYNFDKTWLHPEWREKLVNQWNPGDPNDILGYMAPSGSKAVGKEVTAGYYTIEFENDPEIANAAAHTIVICDTLDGRFFDLSSFEPTGIKLGEVMTNVGKDTHFPITIDLRPTINVIAQVDLDYNQNTGIVVWKITSLDPMTLEETSDAMQGVLPVNINGNGQGEVMFNIRFKDDMAHGIEITNQAGIVFDREGLIMTPTWVNVVDTIAPTSAITSYKVKNGCEITLEWTGEDIGSGIWHYDIYAKASPNGLWHRVREGIEGETTTFTLTEEGEFGFCVVAIDMAGNREHKLMKNELANDELISDIPINISTASPKKNGFLYDLSGKRTNAHRTGVYVKDGRLQVIVR